MLLTIWNYFVQKPVVLIIWGACHLLHWNWNHFV